MKNDTKNEIISIGKDILISLIIIGIILGSLYVFSGRWPPLVVIESSSMSHNAERSQVGVIDAGDIVLVQEVEKDEITTYVEGRANGYEKYGQYGDVIVFNPDGNRERTPVIHRAVFYLEIDEGRMDVPALADLDYGEDWEIRHADAEDVEDGRGLYGTLTIYDYGHEDKTVSLNLEEINGSGFITKGDNNQHFDQDSQHRGIDEPIKEDWLLGRARGQLPWFGILKLAYMGKTEYIPSNSWNNLIISLTVIILIPLILELMARLHRSGKKEKESGKDGKERKEFKISGDISEIDDDPGYDDYDEVQDPEMEDESKMNLDHSE